MAVKPETIGRLLLSRSLIASLRFSRANDRLAVGLRIIPAKQQKMAAGSVRNERSVTTPHVALLLLRLIEFFHPVLVFQNLARLGAVRGADDAVFLHEIDQTGGAAVTDA